VVVVRAKHAKLNLQSWSSIDKQWTSPWSRQ